MQVYSTLPTLTRVWQGLNGASRVLATLSSPEPYCVLFKLGGTVPQAYSLLEMFPLWPSF